MKQITLMKNQRGSETLRPLDKETVVEMMRQGDHSTEDDLLRAY